MSKYLAHIPVERIGTRPDGRPLWRFKMQKVDEDWIRKHYGSPVLAQVDKEGLWEDDKKEVAIVKTKPQQEAL